MKPAEVRRILQQVTDELLGEMRRDGFYPYVAGSGKRFDPLVWDINNGYCGQWAGRAADLIDGAYPVWIEGYEDDGHPWYHCVLVYEDRYYDADCPDGVDDVDDLPMFTDPGYERPEPLDRRCDDSRTQPCHPGHQASGAMSRLRRAPQEQGGAGG
jgi:hypothetical protein